MFPDPAKLVQFVDGADPLRVNAAPPVFAVQFVDGAEPADGSLCAPVVA